MALLHMSFLSHSLGIQTNLHLLLPEQEPPKGGYQVLYLLHGYMGDGSDWVRQSNIERYMEKTGVLVVMPDGGKGFYTDTATGDHYWSFLSKELPALLERYFPISRRREDTFAIGLSMGGYGAIKLGLRQPERFSYVASFSGVLDVAAVRRRMEVVPNLLPNCIVPPNFDAVFGTAEDFAAGDDNLLRLLQQSDPARCPKLSFYCGTEDFLLSVNRKFCQIATACNLSCTMEELPGGHEWVFWDKALKKTLDRLPLQK